MDGITRLRRHYRNRKRSIIVAQADCSPYSTCAYCHRNILLGKKKGTRAFQCPPLLCLLPSASYRMAPSGSLIT